jgi:hypothetical protein
MQPKMKTLGNSTSSIIFEERSPWIYVESSICSRCQPWIWTQQSGWPPLNFAPRRKPDPHQESMLCTLRERRKELRLLHKTRPTVQRNSNNNNSKTHLHKIVKTFATRTTIGAIRINLPGNPTTLATTATETR